MARAKPRRAASRSRRSRPWIGRSSPVRPISPHRTVPGRDRPVAQRRREGERQRQVERGLLDGQATDDAGVDVVAGQVDARMPAQHSDQQRQALGSRPDTVRRGEPWTAARRAPGPRPAAAGCPRASPRRRRPARRASPARGTRRPGSATSRRPSAAISNTPTSSVEPKRFLLARSSRRPQKRSPSSVSTTSTRCSSVFGPASVPSLVTWPTRMTGTPFSLA